LEKLAKTVEQILDQYAKECMGNRTNQFSMISLKKILLDEIKNYKPTKK